MAGKFEYRFVTAHIGFNKERQMESLLDHLGREGWEVVSHAVAGADLYSVILKRALG